MYYLLGALIGFAWMMLSKKAPASSGGLVQTATVGNRVYSITRLGQGAYLVTLVSTGGVLETSPTNYTFNQSGPLGSIGNAQKLKQLQTDMNSFNVSFSS